MKRFIAFFLGILSALIILLVFHFFSIPYLSEFIEKLELQTVDLRMRYTTQPEASEAIKLVLVEDATNVSEKLAQFIQLISSEEGKQFKPKVIGFNYSFDVPTANEELVTAASIAGNIYYSSYFIFDQDTQEIQEENEAILPFRLEITDIGDELQRALGAQQVQIPAHKYLTTARGVGFVNTLADSDGVYRRIPLFLRYQGNWYGSLSLLMAMEYMDIESVDMTFYPGDSVEIIQDDGSFMRIPVNQYGQMLINFSYESAEDELRPFETLSMERDILAYAGRLNHFADDIPLATLKDAIVLVSSGDLRNPNLRQPIPLADSYPFIGVHANSINNILQNSFIRELRPEFTLGVIVFIGMLTGLVIPHCRFLWKLALALLIAGLYLLAAYSIFWQFNILLPVMPPLLVIGLTLCLVGAFVRTKSNGSPTKTAQQPVVEKRRKAKASTDELEAMESDLLDIRDELDRKSLRLRSKVEELRLIQEQGESEPYDYSRQIASLQKEIRAREIEIKSLAAKEEELRRHVENLPFTEANLAQVKQNAEQLERFFSQYGFVSSNEYVLRALQRVEKLSKTSVAFLIQGEPGTGKKLLARIIRELSSRHNRPIVEVICAGDMDLLEDDLFGHKKGAFPGAEEHRVGFFRKVDEGTLVLEDIENLSLEIQTRLIQTCRGKAVRPIGDDHGYPVDVRIIATTNHNLRELVSEGLFREDLYHYFSIFPLYLPPLRERKEDIPALINHFIEKYNRVHSKIVEQVSDEAQKLLLQHQWPGNITELEKVMERAIAEANPGEKVLSEHTMTFEEADLSGRFNDPGMLNYLIALMDSTKELPDYQQLREKVLVEIQRMYCARLLRLYNGNVKNAAISAGLKAETFKKMLSELMIDPDNYRI